MSDTSDKSHLVRAWLNPLQLLDSSSGPTGIQKFAVSRAEDVFQFVCQPEERHDIPSLLQRYQEIDGVQPRVIAVPADQRVLDKLVWPLRHAKASFVLGNYLGTVSHVGMVCEMLAILLFDLGQVSMNDRVMDEAAQKSVFGSSFEKLGQHRRVEVLAGYDLISSEQRKAFDLVRERRRRYLHLWSEDHDRPRLDALDCYRAGVQLLVDTIGQDFQDGKILLNARFVKYLQRHGAIESANEGDATR